MENCEFFIKFADCRSKVSISWKIHILLQYFNCPAEIFHQAFWNMLSGFRKYFIRLSENIQSWKYFNFWLKYSSPAESVVLSSALLHIPCQGRTLKLCPKCWWWTCFLKFNTLKNGAIESSWPCDLFWPWPGYHGPVVGNKIGVLGSNFHPFCRILDKAKSQWSELSDWISLISKTSFLVLMFRINYKKQSCKISIPEPKEKNEPPCGTKSATVAADFANAHCIHCFGNWFAAVLRQLSLQLQVGGGKKLL